MSGAYVGGFRLCPGCGCPVAADRLELHQDFHDSLLLQGEAPAAPAPLDVREWPQAEPETAPTEPVATPPHEEPVRDRAATEDELRDFARF